HPGLLDHQPGRSPGRGLLPAGRARLSIEPGLRARATHPGRDRRYTGRPDRRGRRPAVIAGLARPISIPRGSPSPSRPAHKPESRTLHRALELRLELHQLDLPLIQLRGEPEELLFPALEYCRDGTRLLDRLLDRGTIFLDHLVELGGLADHLGSQ